MKKHFFNEPSKTETENRTICLTEAAVMALKHQMTLTRMHPPTPIECHTREYGETFRNEKSFVFLPAVNAINGKAGLYYSTESIGQIGQIWTAALKKSGIRHRKTYQSRYTYACQALTAGANPNCVAAQRGHSDAQMRYRVYGAWMPENNADRLTHERETKRSCATYVLRQKGSRSLHTPIKYLSHYTCIFMISL